MSKKNNWEERFENADFLLPDEASARVFKGHSELVDWDKLKSFIGELLEEARREEYTKGHIQGSRDEFNAWSNQPANEHDNKIRQQERQKLREMIEKKMINKERIDIGPNRFEKQAYNQALEELLKEIK